MSKRNFYEDVELLEKLIVRDTAYLYSTLSVVGDTTIGGATVLTSTLSVTGTTTLTGGILGDLFTTGKAAIGDAIHADYTFYVDENAVNGQIALFKTFFSGEAVVDIDARINYDAQLRFMESGTVKWAIGNDEPSGTFSISPVAGPFSTATDILKLGSASHYIYGDTSLYLYLTARTTSCNLMLSSGASSQDVFLKFREDTTDRFSLFLDGSTNWFSVLQSDTEANKIVSFYNSADTYGQYTTCFGGTLLTGSSYSAAQVIINNSDVTDDYGTVSGGAVPALLLYAYDDSVTVDRYVSLMFQMRNAGAVALNLAEITMERKSLTDSLTDLHFRMRDTSGYNRVMTMSGDNTVTVHGLAGTGSRPVYVDANGKLLDAPVAPVRDMKMVGYKVDELSAGGVYMSTGIVLPIGSYLEKVEVWVAVAMDDPTVADLNVGYNGNKDAYGKWDIKNSGTGLITPDTYDLSHRFTAERTLTIYLDETSGPSNGEVYIYFWYTLPSTETLLV
jgi:hypothetical protein